MTLHGGLARCRVCSHEWCAIVSRPETHMAEIMDLECPNCEHPTGEYVVETDGDGGAKVLVPARD